MKIITTSNGGFCFGVKKAVNTALDASKTRTDKKIFTLGPIIHNSSVVNLLAEKGVHVITELKDGKDQIVIIRSHGVSKNIYDTAKMYNIELIDTTCPFVRKVQKLANENWVNGDKIIILGNPKHPEIIGINGWVNNEAVIIEKINELSVLDSFIDCNMTVVAQTTVDMKHWNEMTDVILSKCKNAKIFNTICSATKNRQEECESLSKKVDYMIVVGGRNSSNTQKLYEISKKHCNNVVHIESVNDLVVNNVLKYDSIGLAAGASTPEWIIKEIIDKLEK